MVRLAPRPPDRGRRSSKPDTTIADPYLALQRQPTTYSIQLEMADEAARSAPELDEGLEELLEHRRQCPRFRVLVIGRANAGKTTICQKMCNTTDPPVVQGKDGKEV